jgi:hypothetical protein
MNEESFNNPTPYQDINQLLFFAAHELKNILANNIVGFYLTGSLSYNDFVPGRSDIDLLVIVKSPLSKRKIGQVKQMHLDMEKRYPQWAERIECSYLPASELENISPPIAPRPYIGGGIFYPEAPYGSEWIINQWYLYKYAIALIGPGFTTLTAPIHIDDVQKACLADLFTEWAPKINEPEWLENSHYQSYLVLNLCRILYTVIRGDVGSKSVSAKWVQNEYPEWIDLLAIALDWQYDIKMDEKEKVIEFLRFTLDKVVHSS